MIDGDPAHGGDSTARLPRTPVSLAGASLDHPLFGLERRKTAAALAYAAFVVVLFAVRYGARIAVVGDAPLETRGWAFDVLSMVSIVVATATITLVPLVYAAWNGGPGLSAALPFVPIVPPELVSGRYVLGLDWAIALSVGTAAAAVALYATDVRRTASSRPWRTASGDGTLPFVTGCLAVAILLSGSFVSTVPGDLARRYAPFAALLLVPVAVVSIYWWHRLRRHLASTADPADRTERARG